MSEVLQSKQSDVQAPLSAIMVSYRGTLLKQAQLKLTTDTMTAVARGLSGREELGRIDSVSI